MALNSLLDDIFSSKILFNDNPLDLSIYCDNSSDN